MLLEDRKVLFACISGTIISYNLLRTLYSSRHTDDWVPVGTVKNLWVHPIKSCKRKEVFSLYCDDLGPRYGENRDREFVAIEGATGTMLTARTAPRMMLIDTDVVDGVLAVSTPDGSSAHVVLSEVIERRIVHRATKNGTQCDGLDCGDEVAQLFNDYLQMSDIRLIYYRPDLFNGRPCTTDPGWWNNPVPKRSDTVRYVDLSPYHISTEESLIALNKELETPVASTWFRANIVVDHSSAWDEDRWAEIRMGDVVLQCYKPCTRFRLAPDGPLREKHGQSPIFGVNAGLLKPGYVHLGQTVYVKYKPSPF
ncbi:hypothetical protein PRIPAC_80496 [Pristionchus pacificus]|uniref:MOSC domain-containing protein n=1 Tax=Pristionchus pacificus TaxID=54126 RepID=A0A2A6CBP4_PRIPA|nr:hypothetical protein PRIPAC_80496 [Pristionchus pacificus]|eukprot:PDM75520.1 hypothetical protein PRIPAC_42697 [Pristionchus pacificus]